MTKLPIALTQNRISKNAVEIELNDREHEVQTCLKFVYDKDEDNFLITQFERNTYCEQYTIKKFYLDTIKLYKIISESVDYAFKCKNNYFDVNTLSINFLMAINNILICVRDDNKEVIQ